MTDSGGATGYEWSKKARRLRDRATGKFVSQARLLTMRNQIGARQAGALETLTRNMLGGNVSVASWVLQMRGEIKSATLMQYMMGLGGRNTMTPADRGRIGGWLKSQYGYLNGFARDIITGDVSDRQALNRARMYGEATTGAYERARASAWDIALPGYPGDYACKSRCACHWAIRELGPKDAKRIEATWKLGIADHCDQCIENSEKWNPFVIERPIDVGALAERMYAKAEKAEPGVTRDLTTLEGKIDGSLNKPFKLANGKTVYPLDARLKTADSTRRKIKADADEFGMTVTDASKRIKDNLRYTYTLNPDNYGAGVRTVLDGLDDLGYERVAVKNFWKKDDGYTAVHGIYRTPSGQHFEVQFHTSRTLEVKELQSHPLYEKQRELPKESAEWNAYQRQIDAVWKKARDHPPNLSGAP